MTSECVACAPLTAGARCEQILYSDRRWRFYTETSASANLMVKIRKSLRINQINDCNPSNKTTRINVTLNICLNLEGAQVLRNISSFHYHKYSISTKINDFTV